MTKSTALFSRAQEVIPGGVNSPVPVSYTHLSSRTTLNGEQPYPWDLLQPQDVMLSLIHI